jgi:hypothetical protein
MASVSSAGTPDVQLELEDDFQWELMNDMNDEPRDITSNVALDETNRMEYF